MNKSLLTSILITTAMLLIGFFLLHFELIDYGWGYFVVLPAILGFGFGKSSLKSATLIGLLLGLIMFLALLFAFGLEGIICVVMAFPIMAISAGVGAMLRQSVRSLNKQKGEGTDLKSVVFPILVFGAVIAIEKSADNGPVIEEVQSEIVLPYSSMEVYDAIKNVDTLDAEKPFLMQLDLPIPQKCILEEERVGGMRTCYFEGGRIIERVTELEKGKILRMEVVDYELTGRKWLGFEEAIYTFESLENGHCKMIRTTTYTSELYPRFYWRPLEKLGIAQEHEYVFNNLKKDLKK